MQALHLPAQSETSYLVKRKTKILELLNLKTSLLKQPFKDSIKEIHRHRKWASLG